MLVDGTIQSCRDLHRKALGERVSQEGQALWRKQKEHLRQKKACEQKEMRELLENYWPFGRVEESKPRGLRNLRLEGLFPNKDFLNAKRFVGTLDLGRPGGGAPMVSDTGRKVTRTREDPLLRFQFGSNDLRKCVDNTLRYKTHKWEQQEYKKDLDKLVEEKRVNAHNRKLEDIKFEQKQFLKSPPWGKKGPGGVPWRKPNEIGLNFLQSMGWSTEKILNQMNETGNAKKVRKLDPVFYPCRNVYFGSKSKKLSPLLNGKDEGVELVPILAKQRRFPVKVPLDSTDVTNQRKFPSAPDSLWGRQGSAYLRELSQQMSSKQKTMKEMKAEDSETVRRHFTTVDGFWGRPGNGAQMDTLKKRQLDRLLYPQMVPISVH